MPPDPDPDAAQRVYVEWLSEMARALGESERVEPGTAFDALTELDDCTSDPIPQDMLVAAAIRYLAVRGTDEDPGPKRILQQVRAEFGSA
jgi:hypothetical protein